VTCVHSAHGLAPIGRRQIPFYWETPKGQEILVWNGEHYNLGNVMGLCPAASLNYSFEDELDALHRTVDTMPLAMARLPRYLRQLELDDYPYDFVLLHISGATTDNAPPSDLAIRFAHRWNTTYDGPVRLHMSTLSEFCREVREHTAPIPKYRGDWPDWWSDGFVSIPSEVRLSREAMRGQRWLEALAKSGTPLPSQDVQRLEQNLLMFFEHTYNHSESGRAPWDIRVKAVGGNKRAYACAAYDAMMDMHDAVFAVHGAPPNTAPSGSADRFVYKVLNPLDVPVTDLAEVYFDNKDYEMLEIGGRIVDLKTGKVLEHQTARIPRGIGYYVPLTVEACGEALLELAEGTRTLRFSERHFGAVGSNYVPDAEGAEATLVESGVVETLFLKLEITNEAGIVRLVDKESGADLLAPNRDHAPFVPVYESTPGNGRDEITGRKGKGIGRNRKAKDVQRSVGVLRSFQIGRTGKVWTPVQMDYEVAGATLFSVGLTVWNSLPRIDAVVRMHKTSVWDPENFYLALPFAVPGGELWLDKAGAPMRPWRDQLPDTLTDWFVIQEGFVSCSSSLGLAVATPDAPLLQLGPLTYGKRKLMGHPGLDIKEARAYSWLMTNYWGTNFDVTMGGFYEFKYRIEFGKHIASPAQALRQCAALNHGLKTFRVKA